MIYKNIIRHLGGSLCLMALLSTAGHAAVTVPEVAINGVKGGRITSVDGAVQFSGVTSDINGIKRINAQLKNAQSGHYLAPKGQFIKKAIRIPVQFKKKAAQTPWNTLRYKVPAGNYVFLLQVVDSLEHRSELLEIPVVVAGGAVVAQSAATTAKGGAPRVTIQFPKNGAVVQGPAVFSGMASDNGAVSGVVATIMNAQNGLFLGANGQFGNRTELRLRSSGGSNAQWSSPQIQLPAGQYVIAVRGADNDGKVGNWTESKFTVAQAQTAAAPAAVATQPAANANNTVAATAAASDTAANGMSYCANAANDIDGDGFGWESDRSCVVAGSRADTHPNCASSASDPDGDGFGWENERSCIVVAHCASAASDPDGDGFGWENEKSCIVLSTEKAGKYGKCASAASDPDGDGYGWENNQTCLVAK